MSRVRVDEDIGDVTGTLQLEILIKEPYYKNEIKTHKAQVS